MLQGYIKFYRELMEKPIWLKSSPEQKTVLVTLLLLANHKPNNWEWKGKKFVVCEGQFISSLEQIAKNCGKGVSIQNVRTALKRFEKLEFLTDESTKSGRLVTIINWGVYQFVDDELTKQPTVTQQRPNKDLTPNKNERIYNNNIYILKALKNFDFDEDFTDELLTEVRAKYPVKNERECLLEFVDRANEKLPFFRKYNKFDIEDAFGKTHCLENGKEW